MVIAFVLPPTQPTGKGCQVPARLRCGCKAGCTAATSAQRCPGSNCGAWQCPSAFKHQHSGTGGTAAGGGGAQAAPAVNTAQAGGLQNARVTGVLQAAGGSAAGTAAKRKRVAAGAAGGSGADAQSVTVHPFSAPLPHVLHLSNFMHAS